MYRLFYSFFSFIPLVFFSCQENDFFSDSTSQIVVEGLIEDGGFPVVILTRSLPVSSEFHEIDTLSEYIIRWARVTVSDGVTSAVLTGKYDKRYYPPYIYTTSRIRGESGKQYSLFVEYNDFKLQASTYIPSRPESCVFRVVPCPDSDSLYQIKARIRDNANEKNYYQFFTRTGTFTRQYLASYLGSITDDVLNEETDFPVYRGHTLGNKNYTPYFLANDTVSVKFAQVDEKSYRIWDSYTKILSLSSNMFLSAYSNIETNIQGGMGYWCGYSAITNYIAICDSI